MSADLGILLTVRNDTPSVILGGTAFEFPKASSQV